MLFSILASILLTDCKKDPVPPTLSTTAVSEITVSTVKVGGEITDDGGAGITDKGIAFSQSPDPVIENQYVSAGAGSENFNTELNNLTESTLYYVRAYATNKAGTAYGNQESFTTAAITPPTLTTKAITGVSFVSAQSGGDISNNGGAEITAKGICWNTAENPTTENSKTTDGSGNDGYTSNLTSLTPGTVYYVRSYATNSKGTGYGNQVSFTTPDVSLPAVETKAVTEITQNSSVSGGTVTGDGGAIITAKGVCWNTGENPTIENQHTTDGSGMDPFNSNVTGLMPGTTYYLRAYATNVRGTSYGTQVSFTTAPGLVTLLTLEASEISLTTAKSGGEILSNGGSPVTAKGVCWATTENPTIENSHTVDGSGADSFESNITGLTEGTTYYVRAYATNSVGTAYGNQIFFPTVSASLPALSTRAATAITVSTAKSGGDITNDGGAEVTAKGICWSTTENPTISSDHTTDGTGTQGFESNLTGLTDNTTYYIRAYATNKMGTAYGNQITFTTPETSAPALTTSQITALTSASLTSGGNITSDGGREVTQRGVCWSTTPNPTITGSRTTNGTGTGVFTSDVTGLSDGTVYYLRAYATNSVGTSYGEEITLITYVTDIDGNLYKTIKIGDQIWMAENLKTTRFNNNSPIQNVTSAAAWVANDTLEIPGYTWFNNNTANKDPYGGIYNWYAVETGNLCPTGWHVPSEAEFQTLETTVGVPVDSLNTWGFRGENMGTHMKSTTGWTGGNGDNTSGFSVVPAGYLAWADGSFRGLGTISYFWLATDDAINHKPRVAWYRRFDSTDTRIYKATTNKGGGKSIRCLKNSL